MKIDNYLKQKLFDLTDDLRKSEDLKFYRNRLQLAHNILATPRYKDVEAHWDNFEEEFEIEKISINFFPERSVWDNDVTLIYYPMENYISPARMGLELEISEYQTLTNEDEIIKFLKKIEWDEMLEGLYDK